MNKNYYVLYYNTDTNITMIAVVGIYGVTCELASHSLENCSMKSPQYVLNTTVPTSCVIVEYRLSSEDVLLTADILDADGNVVRSGPLAADRRSTYIPVTQLPSPKFAVNFVAKRIQTSQHKTEKAKIKFVAIGQCVSSGW